MLNQDFLLDCLRKAKSGDDVAKEILFTNNTPLIKSIIRRFKNKGIEYDDLYQIASIGFLKAIKNFDECYGVKFSTYAVPMIIGEIKRYMRDNGAIKVSRTLKIIANKISRYIDEYQSKEGASPSIEKIAEVFRLSSEDVVLALDSVKMPLSIFDKFDDEDEAQELMNVIPDNFEEEKLVTKIHLRTVINELSEREKKLIILRYFRDKTQTEIAESLGVSQVQVSRMENKIIDKLRLKF